MKQHDVQSIEIGVSRERAFAFLADPGNLPKWTRAFSRADARSAVMETPNGSLEIGLGTDADGSSGTIDWTMRMPDGSVGKAYSRVTAMGGAAAIYSFVLMAPPVPLEQLEGTLEAQRAILAEELRRLKEILENHDRA